MFKLYLSPSCQEKNIGVDGVSEEARMQALGKNLKNALHQVADVNMVIAMNSPEMTLDEIVRDSDKFKADAHLAIHTNAGPSAAKGMEIYAHKGSQKGEKLAACVAKHLALIKDIPIRGDHDDTPLVRDPIKSLGHRLAEVDKVKAPACLVELIYHTNAEDLKKLRKHWGDIIYALRCAICEYVKEAL